MSSCGKSLQPKAAIYQKSLSDGIAPDKGVEAFRRILATSKLPQVIVSTKDLRGSIDQVNSFAQTNLTEQFAGAQVAPALHPRPGTFKHLTSRRATTWSSGWLPSGRTCWVFRTSASMTTFSKLGGDSVKAIQISVKINEAGLQFTPQQLFQSQTIAELAAVLDPSAALDPTTDPSANGKAEPDVPLAGFSQQDLEKIAMLLEETDRLNESVE